MDFDITTKGKELFLTLTSISLLLMMGITTLLWWFVSPRLHEINDLLADFSLTALRIFYILLIFGTLLVYLTAFTERNFLIANFAVRMFIKILYPISESLGKLVGIDKEKIQESFVYVNNSFIKALRKKFKAKEILILLPHCLQNNDCPIRITNDINNCIQCGKCDIQDLAKLSQKYKVATAIATGGTLARRIIVENKPKFIIAVACPRDMVEGLKDVFPIPVYGVLNFRPNGPCISTRVAVEIIDNALKKLINE
ncbi:MAG: DUF116 domain-containing protein [Candidatus Cloacimonetes bacterium]|nr:DUF116 domain-containing protein [Candidatus Cloacimonadota bacterium]